MPPASDLHESLNTIADRVNDDMSERDVENLFVETGYYDALGYEGTGVDMRSEFTLPDDRRPDYITLNTNEAVSVVYEFKKPTRGLSDHEDQLFHYVDQLQADFGVLTNGQRIIVYQKDGSKLIPQEEIGSMSRQQVQDLAKALEKREFDFTNPDHVNKLLDPDIVGLDNQSELGQEHFFNTFRLEDGSPFADLVTGLIGLLHELRDENEEKFVIGAYDYWEATYANEPDEIPDSWSQFVSGEQSLRDFMFCLETGHALLSRLLLAKATGDHDFFAGTGYNGMDEYFRGLQGFDETINLDAFPVAADNLIDDMQDQLVEGLFQDDIFVWWNEGYAEQLNRIHDSGSGQFQDVARGTGSIDRVSPATRDRFNRAVADVFFNVLRFDFTDVQGDLLGDLYQRYFDSDTRKALGEFYTPQPVVDYIMDEVEYNQGVSAEKLIDPACGSGTFLVEAVERYMADVERYYDDPDWEEHLQDLCTRPRVVGLDVHPFAVLMAQIRFVVAILPVYRKAKEQNPGFTLRRLPIYRTDTLRNERKLAGADIGDDDAVQITWDALTEDEQDVYIPVPLPIEIDDESVETEGGFLVRRVRMPLFDTIKLETGVGNFGEYFAALQGVLDTVKDHMVFAEEVGGSFDWTYQSGLEENINRYTSREYDGVEEFFEPYVEDMLENVRYLQEEHDDGRLFKMFEDTVLALVVKNYMEYDYVVGNPPWGGILLGARGALGNESFRDLLKKEYKSTYGRWDIYVPFIERGVQLLADGGELGYVTQNRFMNRNYGKKIRRLLLQETTLKTIVDFGDYDDLFEDATNYPCILITEKRSKDGSEFDFISFDDDVHDFTVDEVLNAVRDQSSSWVQRHRLYQSKLTTDTWSPAKVLASDIMAEVRDGPGTEVGSLYDATQGCTIGGKNCEEIFVLSETEAEQLEIEDELLQKVLKGSDIEKWSKPTQNKLLIYPYDEDGTVVDLDEFSAAQEYLNKHKETLESRELDGKLITEWNKEWYELWRPRERDVLDSEKIITPRLSTENCFAVDLHKHFLLDSGVGLTCPEEHYEYLLGVLNSTWTQLYINSESTYVQNRYWNYSQTVLESLPIASPQSVKGTQLYQKISSSVEKIIGYRDLMENIQGFPHTYIVDSDTIGWINYTWQTKRTSVDPSVTEHSDGVITVDAGNTDSVKDPLLNTLTHGEYVKEAVSGMNVDSGEQISIPIPKNEKRTEEILEELRADESNYDEEHIEQLEEEIDDAVYETLQLTDDEIQTVENCIDLF